MFYIHRKYIYCSIKYWSKTITDKLYQEAEINFKVIWAYVVLPTRLNRQNGV